MCEVAMGRKEKFACSGQLADFSNDPFHVMYVTLISPLVQGQGSGTEMLPW